MVEEIEKVDEPSVPDEAAVSQEATEDGAQFEANHEPVRPGRDVPVSALVHLLGLPTSAEIQVIESKLDILSSRISAIASKVDRLSQQVGTLANEFYIDRIDFQISEIRTLMKRVFPQMVSDTDFSAGSLRELKKDQKSE